MHAVLVPPHSPVPATFALCVLVRAGCCRCFCSTGSCYPRCFPASASSSSATTTTTTFSCIYLFLFHGLGYRPVHCSLARVHPLLSVYTSCTTHACPTAGLGAFFFIRLVYRTSRRRAFSGVFDHSISRRTVPAGAHAHAR